MSYQDDGGPAFPVQDIMTPDARTFSAQFQGMTLRDWFAGMAMQGDLASQSEDIGEYEKQNAPTLASRSYLFADAMLEARKLKGTK